ncbi:MAG TPA: response regulator [Blastocatellia bacterium]|nr:response regulator [Blastocatellia bacterium]
MGILVIDDEPSVADALGVILRDSGYEVTVAMTGNAGVGHAGQKRFDVAITDYRLPDMSGLEVVSRILQLQPDTLVIVITAHGTPEMVAECVDRGAFDVLAKPFFPSDILTLITKYVDSKRARTAPSIKRPPIT